MIALPILALVGLVAFSVHRSHADSVRAAAIPDTKTSGIALSDLPPHLRRLVYITSSGMEPPRWIIDGAIAEAYAAGQWGLVQTLTRKYPLQPENGEKKADQPPESPQQDTIGVCVGKNSPFDGISNDAWGRFVEKLATQKDDYKTDKHVGRYHHSRTRLGQLGIDPEGINNPEAAYDALSKDLSDLHRSCKALMDRYICHPVNVRGNDCMMTMSGILGLLKAAGPEAARSWIENPRDRDQYPMTTQMFIATNGMF